MEVELEEQMRRRFMYMLDFVRKSSANCLFAFWKHGPKRVLQTRSLGPRLEASAKRTLLARPEF
jgi:hypothetical protein